MASTASAPKCGWSARISVPGEAHRRADSPMLSVIDRVVFTLTTAIFMVLPFGLSCRFLPTGLGGLAADRRGVEDPAAPRSLRLGGPHRGATEDRAPNDAAEDVARVWRDLVLVLQSLRFDDERLVGSNDHEVCVRALADPALPGQAGEARGLLGHPANEVREPKAATRSLGPDDPWRDLERRDTAPGRGEITGLEVLHLGRRRRVVRGDLVDDARAKAVPQQAAVGGFADGRRALECRRAVRDLLGRQRQVVRTRLDTDLERFATSGGEDRQRIRAGEVNDVHTPVRPSGGVDQSRDCLVLDVSRPGVEVGAVVAARGHPKRGSPPGAFPAGPPGGPAAA